MVNTIRQFEFMPASTVRACLIGACRINLPLVGSSSTECSNMIHTKEHNE